MAPAPVAASGPALSSTSSSAKSKLSASAKAKGKAPASTTTSTPDAASLAQQLEEDAEGLDDEDADMDDGTRPSFAAQMMAGGSGRSGDADDDAIMLDPEAVGGPAASGGAAAGGTASAAAGEAGGFLKFGEVKDHRAKKGLTQTAKVPIPPHRMTPLKRSWPALYTPLVEELGLLVRVNVSARRVELKTSKHTKHPGVLPKAIAFLQAFALGFTAEDSLALLRLEDIYIESFEIKDVKTLHGDHLSRAIGRIAGRDGRTRFTIENSSRTRIVLADTKIHILGTFTSIKIARDAVCALILGSPPGKVYHGLRTVAARQRERF